MRSPRHFRRAALIGAAAASLLGLAGCAPAQAAYCADINASRLSAVTYTSYIGDVPPAAWAEPRIELLDAVGAPTDELESEHETWLTYLHDLAGYGELDPSALKLSTGEVDAARQALFDNYVEACL
ncbi:hypothetical protein GCM10011490_10850 [Pseudoclavibacter endophyticus]|uniref:Uncharacterized protein n=1 Tax=Pseudoclavibacter endophyticus TaxID=1778590 RepID=A0A6H9WRT6_9MICO|nr:hypothetical protein [Pseudoclavibacter endophyticus]KAB1649485.1 hypothetical protein F8O04_04275 [Pseudoclavibacter endophyticus]GGA62260.1 hypothetical protein GCM10011490_10850 [Pseudoclavibacter endophyticus]